MVDRFNRCPLLSVLTLFGCSTCSVGNHEQSILLKRSRERLNFRKRLILHVIMCSALKEKEEGKRYAKKYLLYTIILCGSFGEVQDFFVSDLNSFYTINTVSSFRLTKAQDSYPITCTCHLQFVCIRGVCMLHVGEETLTMAITKGYGGSFRGISRGLGRPSFFTSHRCPVPNAWDCIR